MSGLDPTTALAAEAALQQSAVAAIDFGVAIEILQSQLSLGDLITATILPPQGGSDRLALLGQTVLAQLPPGVDPGQSLLLQITGFNGNQIIVRNLGVVDPNNPPPTVNVTLPEPAPGTPAQATLTTVITPKPPAPPAPVSQTPAPQTSVAQTPAQKTASTQPAVAQAQSAPVAPPRAVFVAASVKPVQPAVAAEATEIAQTVVAKDVAQLGLEARIAATHAASLDIAELVNAPGKPATPQPQSAQAQSAQAASAQTQSAKTQSVQTQSVQTQSVQKQAASAPPIVASSRAVPAAQVASAARAAVAPIAPELALLARLRIPTLPFTLAAARLAGNATASLPRVLARLDAALAGLGQSDARAASLRTLLPFVARIDPSNARALPERLMAFVSNVVDAAESKLASIVRSIVRVPLPEETPKELAAATVAEKIVADAKLPAAPLPAAPAPSAAAPATSAPVPASAPRDASAPPLTTEEPTPQTAAAPAAQPAVAAHVAERVVALQYDLKAAIVSMIETPPHGAPPGLAPALSEALTAVTAVQLNVLNAQNTDPSTIAIALPVFFHESGRPTQLRISRDAPDGRGKLDGDNFHIAFVLDTNSLGTVAVDVQTASRSVSVNVKTEGSSAAGRFKETLDDLRTRLESLNYRVANISAAVAPHQRAQGDVESQSVTVAAPDRTSNLDLQA